MKSIAKGQTLQCCAACLVLFVLLLGAGCGGENGSLAIHDTLMETEHEQAVLSGEVSFGDQDAIISMSWENVTTGQSGPADSIYPADSSH